LGYDVQLSCIFSHGLDGDLFLFLILFEVNYVSLLHLNLLLQFLYLLFQVKLTLRVFD